ncbi:putative immunity protein, partial [Streptomyces sp. NPDC051098]|uniref:putative immunity protein n=1 Tax=Streptomyces sp. NPDC051098 TaxID=3155411 RepID=UPI0034122117
MPTDPEEIDLSEHELREIAGYAADCARRTLSIFEQSLPDDTRPREAIDAAHAFAAGGLHGEVPRRSGGAARGLRGELTGSSAP